METPAPIDDAICTENEAAIVCAVVAAQIDSRFVALDLSRGSKILWPDVAADVSKATQRPWTPAMCQRAWRWVAYAEDIGNRGNTLPDSDGEDDEIEGVHAIHKSTSYA